MTHTQIFKKADNEDGFISVICHRERYLEALKAEGWVESVDEALAQGETADTDTEKQALIAKAKELGVQRAGSMGVDKLKEEIAKAEHDNSSDSDN